MVCCCVYGKRTSIFFITSDVVSLFMVPKLPSRAKIHHVCAAIIVLIGSMMDVTLDGWAGVTGNSKMILVYGFFCSMGFPLTAYLALRVVYPKARWLTMLHYLSMWSYILVCAVNWTTLVIWIFVIVTRWEITVYNLLYIFGIGTVVQTNVATIKWLWKKSSYHAGRMSCVHLI